MDSIECIPSDPDISGIGVRVAIYAQNLLSFIPAILALWDGEVSLDELKAVEKQSTTILITAFAILISAMVQAWTHRLSNFHASIILNLSWMNNTNTFIYLLLYIQHRSQPGPAQISMDVRSWLIHIAMELDSLYHVLPGWDDSDIPIREILKRIVYVLGAFHLALMAAFGIWLWSSPRSFGSANMCAIDNASTFILGNRVPLHSDALRAWSIAIYSLFLLPPGLNLFLPLTLFLGLCLTYQARRQRLDPTNGQRGPTFSARTNPQFIPPSSIILSQVSPPSSSAWPSSSSATSYSSST
ncbi:hypothetical protein C8J57DRAFT_249710 [Mycena rebaudengoi]|nr:hypothetical protein C8J57DRAFT_249710 [Mycena rebaudengoi]